MPSTRNKLFKHVVHRLNTVHRLKGRNFCISLQPVDRLTTRHHLSRPSSSSSSSSTTSLSDKSFATRSSDEFSGDASNDSFWWLNLKHINSQGQHVKQTILQPWLSSQSNTKLKFIHFPDYVTKNHLIFADEQRNFNVISNPSPFRSVFLCTVYLMLVSFYILHQLQCVRQSLDMNSRKMFIHALVTWQIWTKCSLLIWLDLCLVIPSKHSQQTTFSIQFYLDHSLHLPSAVFETCCPLLQSANYTLLWE